MQKKKNSSTAETTSLVYSLYIKYLSNKKIVSMNQFANKCVGEQEIANRKYVMYIES